MSHKMCDIFLPAACVDTKCWKGRGINCHGIMYLCVVWPCMHQVCKGNFSLFVQYSLLYKLVMLHTGILTHNPQFLSSVRTSCGTRHFWWYLIMYLAVKSKHHLMFETCTCCIRRAGSKPSNSWTRPAGCSVADSSTGWVIGRQAQYV